MMMLSPFFTRTSEMTSLVLMIGAAATAVVVVVLTYLSLILGELVPKRLALIHPEGIAALVAPPEAA